MNSLDQPLRVETFRSGIFVFQIGVDLAAAQPLIDRIEDAHKRFSTIPILPVIATQLEKEALVSSVFGTNTIEGGTLTEEETATVLAAPENAREEKELRVANIRRAYEIADNFAENALGSPQLQGESGFATPVLEFMLKDLHKAVTAGLSHPHNIPGEYRTNHKDQRTQVGDAEHGGIYTPPKCREDIDALMRQFLEWLNSDAMRSLSPLIRAPLTHYYFERIHPFWDGNGRVGRVLEALVMKCAGYQYAPFALSKYYLEHIDDYFNAFNLARKEEAKKSPYPNQVFVELFLRGMLDAFNRLHDRVNRLIGLMLYNNQLYFLRQGKQINDRQYTIIANLLPHGHEHNLVEVKAQPWFTALYLKLSHMTQTRDLHGLVDKGLIELGKNSLKLRVY
ncbi:MAG: Fic family protein [Sulfuricella sp.]|nr:Fic family protein [Sulfuricella sp.]